MKIKTILNKHTVNLDVQTSDKLSVICLGADLLLADHRIKNKEDFIKAVYEREKIGSTNMGQGIAVPHCITSEVKQTSIVILKLNKPIDWESGDSMVDKIFFFAVSNKDPDNTHILLLSKIAEMLIDDEFLEMMNTNKDKERLLHKIYENIGGSI